MRVAKIETNFVDHPTLPAISVYFRGCDADPKCEGCHNPELWEYNNGEDYSSIEIMEEVAVKAKELLQTYDKVAVVFVGGEPTAPYNINDVMILSNYIKSAAGNRVVTLLYSWRTKEELMRDFDYSTVLKYIDEFVLGRFIQAQKIEGRFPASINQVYVKSEDLW